MTMLFILLLVLMFVSLVAQHFLGAFPGMGGQILLTRSVFDDARQYVRQHPPLGEGAAPPPPPIRWVAHGRYVFIICHDGWLQHQDI